MIRTSGSILIGLFCLSCHTFANSVIRANSDDEIRLALLMSNPGDTIQIAPGTYGGGFEMRNKTGITIEASDTKSVPHFRGGSNAFHFSACKDLTVRNLAMSGQTANGINIDDGGVEGPRTLGITLENLIIDDIGPQGNHDGIKCSGLAKFRISACRISGWGGQGIDCVGCHEGVIKDCRFVGKPGFSATAAIQIKGGSSKIVVEKCEFIDAGQRAINIGGSTGKSFFRPQNTPWEASEILVRNNRMEGSMCAAAFVGVQGARFENNLILFPSKWIFRTLLENREAGFSGSKEVFIENNSVVFRRSQVQSEINVGSGAELSELRFARNRWYAEDRPSASKPASSVIEIDGEYGIDPRK